MSWYGGRYEDDGSTWLKILVERFPRRVGESREDWLRRVQPQAEVQRIRPRRPGETILVRSANAVPGSGARTRVVEMDCSPATFYLGHQPGAERSR